jgi:putative flippase GtrA
MIFNFACVKRMVFNSRGRVLREFLQYTALVAVSGTISFGLIAFFIAYLSISVLKAKLLAEGILFLGNFLVQRDLIFTGANNAKDATPEDAIPTSAAKPARELDARP